jgi:hypothetical protein
MIHLAGVSQSVNQSISRPGRQSVHQYASQPVIPSFSQSVCQSVLQSGSQSGSPSISQSLCQRVLNFSSMKQQKPRKASAKIFFLLVCNLNWDLEDVKQKRRHFIKTSGYTNMLRCTKCNLCRNYMYACPFSIQYVDL